MGSELTNVRRHYLPISYFLVDAAPPGGNFYSKPYDLFLIIRKHSEEILRSVSQKFIILIFSWEPVENFFTVVAKDDVEVFNFID